MPLITTPSLLQQFVTAVTPNSVKESTRENAALDYDFFVASYIYYFELLLPDSLTKAGNQSFLIPLVLAPDSISMDEPFAMEPSMTQGGGVYVEEQGILVRNLRIRGTTGWEPIAYPFVQDPGYLVAGRHIDRSFDRSLPGKIVSALSGQRHLQYLQDAFRTYADAKRDPAHAAHVKLLFHNPRDKENWEVKPRSFAVDRNAGSPLSYPYSIDLLIVGPASYGTIPLLRPADTNVLTAMRNKLSQAATFVSRATAYVNQLTAVAGQMRQVFKSMDAVIGSVFTLINAASAFVSGATTLIKAPYALVASTAIDIETSLALIQQNKADVRSIKTSYAGIPAIFVQTWRNLVDVLFGLGSNPSAFENDSAAQIALIRAASLQTDTAGVAALAAAATASNPTSFAQANKLGTNLLPADAVTQSTSLGSQSTQIAFTSTSSYVVQQGDTLVSIAAKKMGDARLWVYLAVANGLKLPLADAVSSMPLTSPADTGLTQGSLNLGSTIYIPNFEVPAAQLPDLNVIGGDPNASADAQILGTDFALTFAGAAFTYSGSTDAILDLQPTTGGSDVQLIAGVPNLEQAVLIRLTTEQGTDTLVPSLGLQSIVSLNLAAADAQTIQYRLQSALLADPRITSCGTFTLSADAADAITVEGTVQATGLTQATNISLTA
ncbi:MAG: LysM peptidoglycan-binding domain-containing protein [Janthinobacterium lividum]